MRRKAALLVVLFTSGAGLGQMQGPIAAQQEIGQARSTIPDFSEVTPTLYRGGQPVKDDFAILSKLGIDIVVDLRGDRKKERQIVTSLGMKYVPMHWNCPFPRDRTFARFLTLIHDNPGKKIFVHCRLGDDRAGMMIAAYRMAVQGWSAERAKEEMVMNGFSFVHRHFICIGLASYESHFPDRFATKPEFEELRQSGPKAFH